MNSKPYFSYSTSLRIKCHKSEFEEITNRLNLPNTNRLSDKVWIHTIQDADGKNINEQLIELWNKLKDTKQYLISLMEKYEIDIICSYTSDCDHAGIEISSEALEIFTELGITFGLSIVVL